MTNSEIQSYITTIEESHLLYEEKGFDEREEALDFIEFELMERLEGLTQPANQPDELSLLKLRVFRIKSELEEVNTNLFAKLRANIQTGKYKDNGFKNLVNKYVEVDLNNSKHQEEAGYDNLDIFINRLFPLQSIPEQTKDLEPEMVYYQKTPARRVFELAETIQLVKEDVFFDLGSGLGQVAILINLLTGVKVKGIEYEPAFCAYARHSAIELNLSAIEFINADARKTNYAEGTIFFMFTPFTGEIMQEVLEILRKESLQRKIKIISYGPCTAQVAIQSWLNFEGSANDSVYKLMVFTSV
jgi:hypothetical protein